MSEVIETKPRELRGCPLGARDLLTEGDISAAKL